VRVSSILAIVPTITGREHWLKRCLAAYRDNSRHAVNVWVVKDESTCGAAWNLGWMQMGGGLPHDYLHLSADDLEPQPGWDVAAIEAVETGALPCPLQTHSDGNPFQWGRSQVPVPDWKQTTATTLPFLPWSLAEQILPGLDCHYYVDDWVSWRAQRLGWGDVYREGYRFIHHLAVEGRGAGMGSADARMRHDLKIYEEAKQALEAGS
jgi:hypothetical protein